MQENKTDQQVAGNQGSQQNQNNLVKQNAPKKENNGAQKYSSPTSHEEIPATEKELIDNDHQHDYKAPAAEKNHADENHDHKPTEETSSDKFQTLNEEADNTETLTSETGSDSKG